MNVRFKPPIRTLQDLLHRLGDVPADRVRFDPVPGTATIDDLFRPENKLCELVDGTLVEKPMGVRESILAFFLGQLIGPHVRCHNLGILTGPDGTYEVLSGLVRLPDVAFVSWDRLPGRRVPTKPVPNVVPDLAIEVLSKRNTAREMYRKRKEYFKAGTQRVWQINPRKRTLRAYSTRTKFEEFTESQTVPGEPVLPRFALSLPELFGELDRHG